MFRNLIFELLQFGLNIHLVFTLLGPMEDTEMKLAILLPSFSCLVNSYSSFKNPVWHLPRYWTDIWHQNFTYYSTYNLHMNYTLRLLHWGVTERQCSVICFTSKILIIWHLISRKDSLPSSKQDKQNTNMTRRSKNTESYTVTSFEFFHIS